jgi:superfamily II DNA/RNA helicase
MIIGSERTLNHSVQNSWKKSVFLFVDENASISKIELTFLGQGFEKPSPIQSQAWPYLLSGKDLVFNFVKPVPF